METDNQILQSVRGLFPLITCFEPPSDQTLNDDPIAILDLFIKNFDNSEALNRALAKLKSIKHVPQKKPIKLKKKEKKKNEKRKNKKAKWFAEYNCKWFAEYNCALL